MGNWLHEADKEQMGDDLLDIFVGLIVLSFRLLKRIFQAVQQQPPQHL